MSDRALRVAESVRRELTELVREVRDPRVQGATLLTVTHVRVSDDLGVARVQISVIGDDPKGVIAGLERARGFLQREIGKRMHAKKIPELRFVLDDTQEKAGKVEELLREIHEQEKK